MKLVELFLFLIYLLSVVLAAAIHLKWPDAFKLTFEERARVDAFNLTNPRDNPYAVLVIALQNDEPSGICSGTLVTSRWVLTAAHCLYAENDDRLYNFLVYAGGMSLGELVEQNIPKGAQLLHSARAVVHPKYKKKWINHDVALIQVDVDFILTENVNTIQLTTKPWKRKGFVVCSITGFGIVQMNETHTKLDYRRKKQSFLIKKPCVCKSTFERMLSKRRVINWVCSKPVEDVGLCPGDSGSGLVCNGRLEAVSSSILGFKNANSCEFFRLKDDPKLLCGSKNTVSVFTELCRQMRWLHYVMNTDSSAVSPVCMHADTSVGIPHPNILLVALVVIIFNRNHF